MIDQKNIIIGTVLAVVLVGILGNLIPLVGGIIAMIAAGIVVGYLVNGNFKIGAVNGALVGLFTGIAYILLIYAFLVFTGKFSEKVVGGLIILSLGSIPVYTLLGLGGGIIGSVIKSRQQMDIISDEVDSAQDNPEKDDEK